MGGEGSGRGWHHVVRTCCCCSSAGGASASAVLHGVAASTRSVKVSQIPMVVRSEAAADLRLSVCRGLSDWFDVMGRTVRMAFPVAFEK